MEDKEKDCRRVELRPSSFEENWAVVSRSNKKGWKSLDDGEDENIK